jgi:prolyl 4-hydroxylase
MGTINQLSPEWRDWVVTNIEREVPLTTLIEEMVKNNFDLVFATNTVVQFANDPSQLTTTPMSELTGSESSGAHKPQYKYPVPPGYEQHYDNYQYEASHVRAENSLRIDKHTVNIVGRVSEPDIVILQNVLTPAECDELMALSRPKLERSRIVDHQTGAEEVMDLRSSYGTYFLRSENTLVKRIEQRLAAIIGMPVDHGEGLQILHYGIGAEYLPHYDFFLPESAGSAIHVQKGGQRVITVIMYLNDVEAGGETIFPELNFSVAPRKGSAVYFSYCNSQSKLDRMTLHGGAPVQRGEKWIATLWVRQGIYQ